MYTKHQLSEALPRTISPKARPLRWSPEPDLGLRVEVHAVVTRSLPTPTTDFKQMLKVIIRGMYVYINMYTETVDQSTKRLLRRA